MLPEQRKGTPVRKDAKQEVDEKVCQLAHQMAIFFYMGKRDLTDRNLPPEGKGMPQEAVTDLSRIDTALPGKHKDCGCTGKGQKQGQNSHEDTAVHDGSSFLDLGFCYYSIFHKKSKVCNFKVCIFRVDKIAGICYNKTIISGGKGGGKQL